MRAFQGCKLSAATKPLFFKPGLRAHNVGVGNSSSMRIARAMLMAEPPSIDGNELTDKGYINQRAGLERRAALVERLYANPAAEDVIIID